MSFFDERKALGRCAVNLRVSVEANRPTRNFDALPSGSLNTHIGPMTDYDFEECILEDTDGEKGWTVRRRCENCGAQWSYETDDIADIEHLMDFDDPHTRSLYA